MRPATGHNKGSLAQVAVTADSAVVNRFRISPCRGCVVVLVGRYFTIGALLSDRSGLAMIRAAP
jgi:hypothetical protein